MDVFDHRFRARHTRALNAAGDARDALIRSLEEGEPGLAAVIAARAYAGWWATVIDGIDRRALTPVHALARARDAACHTLVDQATPRPACPFALGQAIADLEAARRFYHDTADALARPPA